MKKRSSSLVAGVVLSSLVVLALFVSPAAAKKKPPPPPPPPTTSTSSSSFFVRSYGDVLDGAASGVTPEAVQATSDGGSIALAHSDDRGVSWVVKLDAVGNPQWQKEIGCLNLPPGGYSLGTALQQTTDGGYVIAGGTRDCDSSPVCLYLTSQACGMITKLDAAGNVIWTRVYSATSRDTSFWDVKQTSDGGFVVVGNIVDANDDIGSVILKVDSSGNAQWQTTIGPSGRTHALLNEVVPAADGGYVAAGYFSTASASANDNRSVLVVKLAADGSVRWQRGFSSFDASGALNAGEFVESLIQTSDGGYLGAGAWATSGPQSCCQGPLLLKLDADGNTQWQRAYQGGVICPYYYPCRAIGGLAYSVHQVVDGGYVVAGAGNLVVGDSAPMVPWLAKTDAGGALLWQHFYYESYPNGGTLSQYFAAAAVTSDGGHLALGFTENPVDFTGELFAVRTDSAGIAGACGESHPATPLETVDPGLVAVSPAFPVSMTMPAQGDLPATVQPTSIRSSGGQC
jgi:hypothetical protein